MLAGAGSRPGTSNAASFLGPAANGPGMYPQMRLVAGLPGSRPTFSEPKGAVCHQMLSWY
jgi:hypothetical protein